MPRQKKTCLAAMQKAQAATWRPMLAFCAFDVLLPNGQLATKKFLEKFVSTGRVFSTGWTHSNRHRRFVVTQSGGRMKMSAAMHLDLKKSPSDFLSLLQL
jgi:hypothetical protein